MLYLLVGAMASRYVRGDNVRLGLVVAAVCHFILAAFEPMDFRFLSLCVVLFVAEWKEEYGDASESLDMLVLDNINILYTVYRVLVYSIYSYDTLTW